MISSISGRVAELTVNTVVIDTPMGLGIELFISKTAHSLCRLDAPVTLRAHLQVAESGMTLFGFADGLEKEVFLALTTVKGVGGKIAMALLQGFSAVDVRAALIAGDSKLLSSVPGVGKKTAERLCFELGPKMGADFGATPVDHPLGQTQDLSLAATVMEALGSLGFERSQTHKAFCQVQSDAGGEELSVEEYILRCLKVLR